MQNKNDIKKTLFSFSKTKLSSSSLNILKWDFENIKDIHWRSSDSDQHSLLFYKIGETVQDLDLFWERIKNSSYKYLIINRFITPLPPNCVVIPSSSWSDVQEIFMDVYYPFPITTQLIGVTGTNGKTTTADFILQLGFLHQKKGLSIGTLGVREYNKTLFEFGLTSPAFIDFRKFLWKYASDKDFCVVEISAHALSQKRLGSCRFHQLGWTSFSQDHLDYYKNMKAYFDAKMLIFDHMIDGSTLWLPSSESKLFQKIKEKRTNVSFSRKMNHDLPLLFQNKFNKDNLELAVTLLEEALKLKVDKKQISKINSPDGRFYLRQKGTSFIIVDFAHTPDALENIAQGLKKSFPSQKLKVLFGCGGDRDKLKRPLMGSIAKKYFDVIYLTSDNPRSEDPLSIMQDIYKGLVPLDSFQQYYQEINRKILVRQALNELGENEVLLLAGKGHEKSIESNGVKIPYSDIEEVEIFLNNTSFSSDPTSSATTISHGGNDD